MFDYKDPDVSQKIKKWVEEKGYKGGVQKAFDTISEYGEFSSFESFHNA